MADHFSGPRAVAEPCADITDLYAFPSPERTGHLVLVLNVFPRATVSAFFSDAIAYRFRLRPAAIAAGGEPAFAVDEHEYTVNCTFAIPVERPGNGLVQTGRCTTSTGASASFPMNDPQGVEAHGLRVFAGRRWDPFFINLAGLQASLQTGRLAFGSGGGNALEGWNVLSVVVEVDASAIVGAAAGPLIAVAGETVTAGSLPIRIERMGRPEVKNIILGPKAFDPVNRDLEIRDLFNQEDPFHVGPAYAEAYRARFNANLAFFDGLDGKTHWPRGAHGTHPLTELLLADFLVVDTSKPYSEESCFEIERSLLRRVAHTTCGGRSYTWLVNAGNGPRVSDGVHQTGRPAGRSFPYLASPNPNPIQPALPTPSDAALDASDRADT